MAHLRKRLVTRKYRVEEMKSNKKFTAFGAMNRRTCCPPGKLKKENQTPHLVVASMMRSGTHLAINMILNNFLVYKGTPLYVNLEMLLHTGGNLEELSRAGGSVVKTHFPQSIECRGHEQEISQFLRREKVILVTRNPQQIKLSLQNFGQWGAGESLKFDEIQREFEDYWMRAHADDVLSLDYADLIQTEKLPDLLRQIEEFTGLTRNPKSVSVIDKNRRFTTLLSKALTRVFGRFAPYINTGIKLGN